MNEDRVFTAHPIASFTLDASEISHVAAPVRSAVGIDKLSIETGFRNTQAVIIAHDGRGIHNEHNDIAVSRLPQERDHAVIGVMEIYPVESIVSVIKLPQ